ncbi:MAG: TonB-dependent receptor, partial [Bacteroidota bacterium]
GNYKIKEGVSVGGNFNYNYSDNNYTMEAFVFEDNERRQIERFHDGYELYDGSIYLDVRAKKWADRFRLTVNATDFYKEVQNGAVIGNTAFGDVFYDGGGLALTGLYEKALTDKIQLYTITTYSDIDLIFSDTTANVYSWSGEVLARRPNERGELSVESLSDRNFSNLANRVNLRWSLTPSDELTLSNIVANQSTLGRDEVQPIDRDFLAREQTLFKNVLGLQYQRKLIRDKLLFSTAGKLYYYELAGVDPTILTDVLASGTDYGYYVTAKYNFTDRFFVRSSFEHAVRIPTFTQFFGNGTNIRSNLLLEPEVSDNFNLGVSYASARNREVRFLVSTNGFSRAQQDLIFPNANTFQRYENADNANTLGVEGGVNVWFRDALRLDVNATRLRQVYGEVTTLTQAGSLEGTDFPNVPKWFYNARLTYTQEELLGKGSEVAVYTQYKYVDQFNFLNVSGTFDPASYVPEQTRVDAGISISLQDRKYTIAFNANNLFDAEVFDNFSVPRPRRNFNLRFGYQFTDLSK